MEARQSRVAAHVSQFLVSRGSISASQNGSRRAVLTSLDSLVVVGAELKAPLENTRLALSYSTVSLVHTAGNRLASCTAPTQMSGI